MSDNTIRLTNESCFDFLPSIDTGSINLALIAPPYEVSRETGFRNGKKTGRDVDRFRVPMDFGEWDTEGFVGLSSVITEL